MYEVEPLGRDIGSCTFKSSIGELLTLLNLDISDLDKAKYLVAFIPV